MYYFQKSEKNGYFDFQGKKKDQEISVLNY